MTKYFRDGDDVEYVVRVEEGHAAECWDYLEGKWVQDEEARNVALDIYNHKAISEKSANMIIERHTKELKDEGIIK